MSEKTFWKQERPFWCPHETCQFRRRVMDSMCGGELPEPAPHAGDMNTHRICLREYGQEEVIDLMINRSDAGWFLFILRGLFGGEFGITIVDQLIAVADRLENESTGSDVPDEMSNREYYLRTEMHQAAENVRKLLRLFRPE